MNKPFQFISHLVDSVFPKKTSEFKRPDFRKRAIRVFFLLFFFLCLYFEALVTLFSFFFVWVIAELVFLNKLSTGKLVLNISYLNFTEVELWSIRSPNLYFPPFIGPFFKQYFLLGLLLSSY